MGAVTQCTSDKMFSTVLHVLLLLIGCMAQEDENTEPRLLSNKNTAAVTGAALGLGIGIAGSILVGKLIEDATKCKQQDVQPPAFGRFLPDLLHLQAGPCQPRQPASNYIKPQQYPSPGYVIPSPSTQYQQTVQSGFTSATSHQPAVSSGYTVPNLHKPTVSSQYNIAQPALSSGNTVPNLHKPTVVSSQYNVPNPAQPTLSSVYPTSQAPKNTYSPVAASQNLFTQTSPHKASVDPPKDVIELVNHDYHDYSDYTDYPLTPNSAIQPRNLGQGDLVKHVEQRQPKSFNPSKKIPNSSNTFTVGEKNNVEPKFSQAAAHKPQPDAVKFESSQREGRTQSQEFHQTVAHKSVPEEPRTSSSSQQPRNTETSFHQTEPHRAEPDTAGPGSRTDTAGPDTAGPDTAGPDTAGPG